MEEALDSLQDKLDKAAQAGEKVLELIFIGNSPQDNDLGSFDDPNDYFGERSSWVTTSLVEKLGREDLVLQVNRDCWDAVAKLGLTPCIMEHNDLGVFYRYFLAVKVP
ncbi:MAG: hypothetical protein K1X83_03935 [Oligoflexia bacterium]|nr:hypothetical protein [Oligoflexia bacterium]